MRNIFLEKSCKIATERISGSIISSFTQFVFIVYKVEADFKSYFKQKNRMKKTTSNAFKKN